MKTHCAKPLQLKIQKAGLSEGVIQARCMALLRARGWFVLRVNGGGFKDARGQFVRTYVIGGLNACAGFPDVLALKNGHHLLLEIKTARGLLSPQQKEVKSYLSEHGECVHIIRSVEQLETLLAQMDALMKESP